MGFLPVDIEVPKLISGLLKLIAHILGFFDQIFPWGHDRDAFFSVGSFSSSPSSAISSTSLSPIMLENIKKSLPVVEYGDFLDRSSWDGEEEEVVCAVCLGGLEKEDEMRELSNCCHVFHKECLDKWVDESQVTCPLCRSALLPIHQGEEMMNRDDGHTTWLVDRISYLFGEDL